MVAHHGRIVPANARLMLIVLAIVAVSLLFIWTPIGSAGSDPDSPSPSGQKRSLESGQISRQQEDKQQRFEGILRNVLRRLDALEHQQRPTRAQQESMDQDQRIELLALRSDVEAMRNAISALESHQMQLPQDQSQSRGGTQYLEDQLTYLERLSGGSSSTVAPENALTGSSLKGTTPPPSLKANWPTSAILSSRGLNCG